MRHVQQAAKTRDYVPRAVMDAQVNTLVDRCDRAETCLQLLLNMIDPKVLDRHGYDWYEATMEVVGDSQV